MFIDFYGEASGNKLTDEQTAAVEEVINNLNKRDGE